MPPGEWEPQGGPCVAITHPPPQGPTVPSLPIPDWARRCHQHPVDSIRGDPGIATTLAAPGLGPHRAGRAPGRSPGPAQTCSGCQYGRSPEGAGIGVCYEAGIGVCCISQVSGWQPGDIPTDTEPERRGGGSHSRQEQQDAPDVFIGARAQRDRGGMQTGRRARPRHAPDTHQGTAVDKD